MIAREWLRAPFLQGALAACRRHLLFAFFFSALLNLLFIAPMVYMLQVYDRVIPTNGGMTLLFLTLVLLFALGTLALLDSLRMRLLARASVRLDRTLSGAIMEATLKRPEISSQRLAKQALREFDTLRQVITGPAIVSLFDFPWVPVYILVAFLIHPWIGALALLGALINMLLAWNNEKATSKPLQQANEAAGRAYAAYEFTIASAETVRAIGARRALVNGHLGDRANMLSLQAGASLGSSRLQALSKFLRLTLQSLALGLGALLAIDAKVSPGAVFAGSFIVGRALAPIDQLVASWRSIVQGRGALRTLRELFDETPADVALTKLPAPGGRLQVEGLTIAGNDRRILLGNATFDIEPGECIAIIGPSGAGKSTLVRAIAGGLVPSAGVIRFDGADQRNWDSELLAEHIGYMPQESSLFAGTVKDNISRFAGMLGSDGQDVDEQAVAAAQLAGAHDMILRLPGGYDYQLGLGGRGLSVGQAQRIALSRALFRNPKYLVLDEPNANLDADGDQQLIQTLSDLKKQGSTILIVAHRLSVLPIIDKLMVVRDGRVAMYGPRDQIVAQLTPTLPAARAAGGGKASNE
ncbi:MAG: type I secretion system permease/ATPase [Sphingomicrobium sp.]